MIFLLTIFGIFIQISSGTLVPFCKAVNVSGVVESSDESYQNGTTVYKFNFKIDIAVDTKNITYPNIVTVSNFEDWSLNSSLYYRTSAVWFAYGYFWGTPLNFIECDYFNETCVVSLPNGQITHMFNLHYIDDSTSIFNGNSISFNDGIFLSENIGYLLNKNYPCSNGVTIYNFGNYHLRSNETMCCIEYDYVEIPDQNDNVCKEFTSTLKIMDDAQNFNLNLTVIYNITNGYYSNTNVNALIFFNAVPFESYSFKFLATNSLLCEGNSSMIPAGKNIHNYANSAVILFQCLTTFYDNAGDLERNFIFNFIGNYSTYYSGVSLGQLNRINGSYYKGNNKPFTIADPCSTTKSSGVPFSTATYSSTFCCTKFKDDATTTTTTILITSTTPKKQSSSNPKSNYIGSPCSDDTTLAWLDIAFVIDTSKAMSKRELTALAAEISTYMTDFSFAQTGDHTVRAAIIGYASDVTTFYQLTDTTNYDDFVDALFNLADHAHPDDAGGNVQAALQQAYNLLQSQKSQRRQVIVLIAAAYSDVGFQGAGVTANIIKQNGVCIVVINFSTSQGVLATTLQNISCSGYYYISNDNDLNLKFPYALTQLNCICPPGSLQFKVYNMGWGNYTNYADCLFGFGTPTFPKLAERSCQPGVLAAVTSQSKLDFITDNIVPYAFSTNQKKKFTIGLHKSASDNFEGEWKWWGYNKTEYPLENFPSMVDIPDPKDNYGYMWNHYAFNWSLQTGNNIPLPYICQLRACDAEYICDQKQTKQKFKLI